MALSDQELKEIAYLARINIKEDSFSSLKKEDMIDYDEKFGMLIGYTEVYIAKNPIFIVLNINSINITLRMFACVI